MRRLIPLLVLAFSACSGPLEQTCERLLVDSSGNLNQGFGGAPASRVEPPLGLVGTPITARLFAPLTACVSDALRADAKLLDPDNVAIPMSQTEPMRAGVQGTVALSITFTPTQPGVHTLQVSFEPSIGVRNLLINVAADGLRGATTRVRLPESGNCPTNGVWPLAGDVIACEEQNTGNVAIISADGGLTSFPGAELVVADTVLWSVKSATNTLERRLFQDGGVRLTHSFPNFPPLETPAMHDVDRALRYRSNGRLTLVRLQPDAGTSVQELTLDGTVGNPLAYFAEDNDVVYRWSQLDCSFSNCINLPDVAALEPGLVWRTSKQGFESAGRTSGFSRPTTQSESTPRVTLQHAVEPATTPLVSFERLPLWLTFNLEGKRVLISSDRGPMELSAWPRSAVLRVGRKHLVLTDPDPFFVRVIEK